MPVQREPRVEETAHIGTNDHSNRKKNDTKRSHNHNKEIISNHMQRVE